MLCNDNFLTHIHYTIYFPKMEYTHPIFLFAYSCNFLRFFYIHFSLFQENYSINLSKISIYIVGIFILKKKIRIPFSSILIFSIFNLWQEFTAFFVPHLTVEAHHFLIVIKLALFIIYFKNINFNIIYIYFFTKLPFLLNLSFLHFLLLILQSIFYLNLLLKRLNDTSLYYLIIQIYHEIYLFLLPLMLDILY